MFNQPKTPDKRKQITDSLNELKKTREIQEFFTNTSTMMVADVRKVRTVEKKRIARNIVKIGAALGLQESDGDHIATMLFDEENTNWLKTGNTDQNEAIRSDDAHTQTVKDFLIYEYSRFLPEDRDGQINQMKMFLNGGDFKARRANARVVEFYGHTAKISYHALPVVFGIITFAATKPLASSIGDAASSTFGNVAAEVQQGGDNTGYIDPNSPEFAEKAQKATQNTENYRNAKNEAQSISGPVSGMLPFGAAAGVGLVTWAGQNELRKWKLRKLKDQAVKEEFSKPQDFASTPKPAETQENSASTTQDSVNGETVVSSEQQTLNPFDEDRT